MTRAFVPALVLAGCVGCTGDLDSADTSSTGSGGNAPTSSATGSSTSTAATTAVTTGSGSSASGSGGGGGCTGPFAIPSYTPRTNKRHIAPNGSDAADGLTPATAWATLSPHVASLPEDTEVIYADGTYENQPTIYSSYGGTVIAPHVTIRATTLRGAILKGPTAGDAFTIDFENGGQFSNDERDLEIWGLDLRDWQNEYGNGVITIAGNVDGLRIVGNRFENNGTPGSTLDHTIYMAGGAGNDYGRAPRNIEVSYNEIASMAGGGAALIHLYNNLSESAPHDVVVRHNVVRATCQWGMILTPFWSTGGPANWRVEDNDLRLSAGAAVIDFWDGSPFPLNGADASFVVRNNVLTNADAGSLNYPGTYGVVILKRTVSGGGAQHTPTIDNNLLFDTGGQPITNAGWTLDPSNTTDTAPGPDPVYCDPG